MPTIEYATLAAHAEAINGLLYLQGAGLADIQQPRDNQGAPGVVHVGIGVSILIGWNEAGRQYPLTVGIVNEDGSPLLSAQVQVEASPPPGHPDGADLRSVLAVAAEIQFPTDGGYELRAELDGQIKTVAFRVHQQQPPPPVQSGPASWPTPRAD